MADEADEANDLAERAMAKAMAKIEMELAKPALEPKGICYNCEEPVEGAKLFCDKYCCEDYEKYVLKRRS